MINGFSQNLRLPEVLGTFCQMQNAGESPTQFAFSSVVRACASLGWIEITRQMHCLALKCGFGYELFVGSNLADMYSKCGAMVEACKVFEEMPCKDGLLTYKSMINDGFMIDHHVLCSTLSACGAVKSCNFGKLLHLSVLKLGFELKIAVGNALTDMHAKTEDMESSSNVFGTESEGRSVVSCTSLIDGYVENDRIDKALYVFANLWRQGVEPNEYTFSSLIKACANQAALEQGTQLHAQVVKFNFDNDPYVSSILHYKKTCKSPLASCHVYGAHTRGKLFATSAQRGRSGCCEMYNLPRVHVVHVATVSRVTPNTLRHISHL
jgi:pentatricopeptide repeat protein